MKPQKQPILVADVVETYAVSAVISGVIIAAFLLVEYYEAYEGAYLSIIGLFLLIICAIVFVGSLIALGSLWRYHSKRKQAYQAYLKNHPPDLDAHSKNQTPDLEDFAPNEPPDPLFFHRMRM